MSKVFYLTETGNGCTVDGTIPSGAVVCTLDQYNSAGTLMASGGAIVTRTPVSVPLGTQAQAALDRITGPRGTIIRCVAAGVAVPPAWTAHVQALRAITDGSDTTSTVLPPDPAYPAGT